MNPYLMEIAKQHQAEVRREVDTRHKLKDVDDREHPDRRREISSRTRIPVVAALLLGFLKKDG